MKKPKRFHSFTRLGKYFVLDGDSGAFFEIDKEAFGLLQGTNRNPAPGLLQEYRELLQEPSSLTAYREAALQLENRERTPRALCLMMATCCDMACAYCFVSQHLNGAQGELMSWDTAQASVDFLMRQPAPKVELDFFGGEPLLNWGVVRRTIIYAKAQAAAKQKALKLALTTNALNLKPAQAQFLAAQEVNLTLSLDGDAETHNRLRKTKTGRDSFARVFSHIQTALVHKQHQDYYIRGTYTSQSLEFSRAARFMAEAGFNSLSLEPVVTGQEAFSIQARHLPEIERQYELLSRDYARRKAAGKGFDFYHFNLNLHKPVCIEKRLQSCGAGLEYLAVAPGGELYPCHQFVGLSAFKLGTVSTGVSRHRVREKFQRAHIFNQPECLECWAKFYCSGGCYASNWTAHRDILKPDALSCAVFKLRLEYALALQSET